MKVESRAKDITVPTDNIFLDIKTVCRNSQSGCRHKSNDVLCPKPRQRPPRLRGRCRFPKLIPPASYREIV